eukprot:1612338-Amphidinium_carterae.1
MRARFQHASKYTTTIGSESAGMDLLCHSSPYQQSSIALDTIQYSALILRELTWRMSGQLEGNFIQCRSLHAATLLEAHRSHTGRRASLNATQARQGVRFRPVDQQTSTVPTKIITHVNCLVSEIS